MEISISQRQMSLYNLLAIIYCPFTFQKTFQYASTQFNFVSEALLISCRYLQPYRAYHIADKHPPYQTNR